MSRIIRIAFSGAPSSGKTTLANALANYLGKETQVSIELVSEYAREFISERGPQNNIQDQLFITQRQADREENALQRLEFNDGGILITDSPLFLGSIYGLDYTDPWNDKELRYYLELYGLSLKALRTYNLSDSYLFHLLPRTPKADGIRDRHLNRQKELNDHMIGMLCATRSTYITVPSQETSERLMDVLGYLEDNHVIENVNPNLVEEVSDIAELLKRQV